MIFEIPDEVFFEKSLRNEAKILFAYLSKVEGASIPVIAQELQVSERSIHREYLRSLERAGFVKVHRSPGKLNEYEIPSRLLPSERVKEEEIKKDLLSRTQAVLMEVLRPKPNPK